MPEKIYLKWKGWIDFKELLKPKEQQDDTESSKELQGPGVYLHVESQVPSGVEYAGYVGKLKNTPFIMRQDQHYHSFLAGRTAIPEQFLPEIKHDWYPGLVKKGKVYEAACAKCYKVIFDKPSYLKLAGDFWDRANAQKIYFGKLYLDENLKNRIDLKPSDKIEYDKQIKILNYIETFLITKLKPIRNDPRYKLMKSTYNENDIEHVGDLNKDEIDRLMKATEEFMKSRKPSEVGEKRIS